MLLVGAASLYPRIWDSDYAVSTHAVTAAKFGEYALLAPAVPLLLRAARDLELVLGALFAWATAAAVVGVLQIFGVDIFDAWQPGRRQPSFLGHYDLAALCGASLGRGARLRRAPAARFELPIAFVAIGGIAGAVGVVVSGSAAAGLGLAAAVAALLLVGIYRRTLTARNGLAAVAVVAVIAGGILIMRGGDVDQFIRFLGIRRESVSAEENVQTYVQRTMLAYIGWRIFLDHPVAGAGWQASVKEEQVYGDYLDDAKREFPDTPPLAFPSPEHPYGIQNAYVQALADLGLIGFAPPAGDVRVRPLPRRTGGASRPARLDARRRHRRRVAPARDGHVDGGRARRRRPARRADMDRARPRRHRRLRSRACPRLSAPAASTATRGRAGSRTTSARRSRAWLEAEAARAGTDLGRYRVLDVGCGIKPYLPYFEPYAAEYVGVDLENPAADLEGSVEALPVEDASFDLVLCTQVLEHVTDPDIAVRELHRVVAPGGRVLASTHGVQVYHPSPTDYWRWTHTGLERLFARER